MESKTIKEIKMLDKLIIKKIIRQNKDELCECNFPKVDKFNPPTATQMQIIDYIIENNNKNIYQKDLENVLGLTRATVSGVLLTMEKNNLITRNINKKDARAKEITLNNDAFLMFKNINNILDKIEEILIRDISEEELSTFKRVIRKMYCNLEDSN